MIVSHQWFRRSVWSGRAVLVTGGFDPLHYGHVRYIKSARIVADTIALGGLVVVGVAPDSYVALKHPVLQALAERMEMADAIKGVDFVIPQDEDTAASVIRAVRPAIFLKGDDWLRRGLPKAEIDAMAEVGGTIEYVPVHDVSSSDLLRDYFWKHSDEMMGRA